MVPIRANAVLYKKTHHNCFKYHLHNIVVYSMDKCTYKELPDIYLTYGESKRNGSEARRLYRQRLENRGIPTFSSADRQLQETGSFLMSNRDAGRS